MIATLFGTAKRARWLAIALASILMMPAAHAFQLSPSGTFVERQGAKRDDSWYVRFTSRVGEWGVYNYTYSVHEEITNLIFDCDKDPDICANPEANYAGPAIIAGVRWNDDPPFRLNTTSIPECKKGQTVRVVTQPTCWYKLFKHAEKRARTTYFDGHSNRWNIMYRSHFGDLQFLHSMASRDGEKASETRQRILLWAEFAWAVATGTQDSKGLLKDVKIELFSELFPKSGQSVFDLFALGNTELRRGIREVAFGSLLHLVEDSFAHGHVDRAPPVAGEVCPGTNHPRPGIIRSFRSYANQDHKIHGHYDSREMFQEGLKQHPNVIDVGKVLLGMFDGGEPWSVVRPYLECVFELEQPDSPGAPGSGLEAS